MTKIVYATAKAKRAAKTAPRSVGKKRVRGPNGQTKTLWTLDAYSPTFGDDLLYVFQRNVAKARRENKRMLGVADVAPRKR